MNHATQKNKVLELLRNQEWCCLTDFLDAYLSEYRTLINMLKKDGYEIEPRPCTRHVHNSKKTLEWRLKGLKENKVIVLTGYAPLKREISQGKLI